MLPPAGVTRKQEESVMPLQMVSCLRSSDAPNDSGLPMDPLARDLGRYILKFLAIKDFVTYNRRVNEILIDTSSLTTYYDLQIVSVSRLDRR